MSETVIHYKIRQRNFCKITENDSGNSDKGSYIIAIPDNKGSEASKLKAHRIVMNHLKTHLELEVIELAIKTNCECGDSSIGKSFQFFSDWWGIFDHNENIVSIHETFDHAKFALIGLLLGGELK